MSLPKEVLDLEVSVDGFEGTIGRFFIELICKVWNEQDCFSGKRPFGNSGWDYPILKAIVKAGFVDGATVDDEGDIIGLDGEYFDDAELSGDVTELIVEYL